MHPLPPDQIDALSLTDEERRELVMTTAVYVCLLALMEVAKNGNVLSADKVADIVGLADEVGARQRELAERSE